MKNEIKISDDHKIIRHKVPARLSHWTLVICFFTTGLSGLSFFFPDFHWIAEILGTPQLARIIHPFTGLIMFASFLVLCKLYYRYNFPQKQDWKWFKNIFQVLKGNEHAVSDNGKYNPGQKALFWTLIVCMLTLLITGIIMWRPYFAHNFSIPVILIAILLHASSAALLFLSIMVHMYMAFWVKGSIRAMVEGWVTVKWARKHHPRWLRQDILPELEKELREKQAKAHKHKKDVAK